MEPKTENTEEQEKTDLELTDEAMDQVAGGFMSNPRNPDQEIII
jgi:hypothetical protein